jgi:hypothetical protein
MCHAEQRHAYRKALQGLTYDNADTALVNAAVLGDMETHGLEETPDNYVTAIQRLRMPCRRCAGTGQFITYVENNVPRGPGGICFRCGGHGYQTHEDGHRNRTHDQYFYRSRDGAVRSHNE